MSARDHEQDVLEPQIVLLLDRDKSKLSSDSDGSESLSERFAEPSLDESSTLTSSSSSSSDEDEAEDNGGADAEWQQEGAPPRLDFTAAQRVNIDPSAKRPFDFFKLFFTPTFMATLVDSINSSALEIFLANDYEHCRISSWKNVNVQEMHVFLGLLFHMGHIKLVRLSDYWSCGQIFGLEYSKLMSRDRFLIILQNICYNDSSDPDNSNKFTKNTNSIIGFFNNLMQSMVVPSRNLTIDESVVLRRGRLSIKQCIKGNRHKYGIKLYVLTDSRGLCLKLHMYTGANDPILQGKGHSDRVVMLLMDGYLDKGYSLYMDDYYNSVGLAETLLARRTYVTGKLRVRRARNPAFATRRFPRGSSLFKFNRRGVCVLNYHNKRRILAISTKHSGESVESTNSRGVVRSKPVMIKQYNKHITKVVERRDEMLSYCPPYPKSMYWYIKIIIHVMQQMFFNAYLLYNVSVPHASRMGSFYDFRITVITELLDVPLLNQNLLTPTEPKSKQRGNSKKVDNTGEIIHMPCNCPRDDRGRTKRRRCILCWQRKKTRRLTLFYCPKCPSQPGLCLECFARFHNYQEG